LQRRLTTSAGVINTQRLHRHEAATTGLAGRLLQRLALPEQHLAHYQMGVAEPGALAQSMQRFQRREIMPAGGDRSWVQRRSIPGVETRAGLEPSPVAIADSESFRLSAVAPRSPAEPASVSAAERGAIAPKLFPSTVADTAATVTPVGTFRIQRRAPSLPGATVYPLAATSHFTADTLNEGGAGANSPAAENLAGLTSGDAWKTVSPVADIHYPTAATSSSSAEDLALAAPPSPAPATGSDLGQSSSGSDAQPLTVAQLKPIQPPMGDGPSTPLPLLRRYPLAEVIAPSPPPSSRALPLASVVSPAIQRSLDHDSGEFVAKPYGLGAIAQISRPSVAESSIQRQADDPMSLQNQASESDPLPLVQGIRPSFAPSSPPLLLLQTSPLPSAPLVQGIPLASQPSLQSGSPAAATPPPLPLVLGAIAPNGTIQRQVTETTVAESSSAPPAPTPVGDAAPAMDAADMADQVSRILARQLAVERERRGLDL
jgi:hypothetical protein